MSGVPRAVDEAISFWRTGHRQEAIAWSEKSWLKRLGAHQDLLLALPNPLSREEVVEHFGRIKDEETAEAAFVAAMVWGYGSVGYGAWRTERILSVNRRAGARLLAVHEATKAGGPSGFHAMAAERLRHLGVAFGTKFLFFSAEAAGAEVRAPVLDRIVRGWLADNLHLRLDIWSWRHPEDYELYCAKLAEWGLERRLAAGEVEEAIFEYATRGPQASANAAQRVESMLEELVGLVDRSRLSDRDKVEASEALEILGRLLGEE